MKRIMKLLVCLLVFAMATGAVVSQPNVLAKKSKKKEEKKEEVVYVTKRGKKYHKEGCKFIKNRETIKMDKKEAEEKGLKPCGWCFKEEKKEKK